MSYKDEIQAIAEDLASTLHEKDFYDLSPDLQYEVYKQAMEDYRDQQVAHAEWLNDKARRV